MKLDRLLSSALLALVFLLTPGAALPEQLDTSRIVSIGSSVTETLYALGVEDRIVAVDTTSLHPPQALKEKASVGYMRRLSPEGVISVNPSVIFAIDGAGPPDAIDVLKRGQIEVVSINSKPSAEGAIEKIKQIAGLVGRQTEGAAITEDMGKAFAKLNAALAGVEKKKSVLFLLSARTERLVAGGKSTNADAIIELAGAKNAAVTFNGYKQISLEALPAMKPDIILVIKRGGHAVDPNELLSHPMVGATPAGKNRQIVAMDGVYLLGFGPRVAQAAHDLASKVYPELNLAKP